VEGKREINKGVYLINEQQMYVWTPYLTPFVQLKYTKKWVAFP
jgi:hypothetical protein